MDQGYSQTKHAGENMIRRTPYFLKKELEQRGFVVTTYDDPYLLHIEKNGKTLFIHAAKTLASAAQFFICKDKYLTSQVLHAFGFAMPKGIKINKTQIANTASLQFPVVVKPLLLSGGEGIEIGVKDQHGIEEYFQTHAYEDVLVEEMLAGDDTRILIIRGKFFAAAQRLPAFVTGDGIHSISELIDTENKKREVIKKSDEENATYSNDLDLILFDDHTLETIAEAGLTPQSIIDAERRVFVRKNANTSTGGISIDVTDQVGAEIRSECERIASSLGMTTIGIDIMTTDLSKALNLKEGSGIVEVNASPGLDLHILTDEGQRRDPVPLIVDEVVDFFKTD